MKYQSVDEFVNDMLNNEGVVFRDNYGRAWSYSNFNFWFQDLGDDELKEGIACLHLYGTEISK